MATPFIFSIGLAKVNDEEKTKVKKENREEHTQATNQERCVRTARSRESGSRSTRVGNSIEHSNLSCNCQAVEDSISLPYKPSVINVTR